MKCAKCGGELPADSKFCRLCGAAQKVSTAPVAVPIFRRNRKTYQLLALFLGGLGIHSFYAGYVGKGVVQLLLCCTGASSIWALVDMFVVTRDADGVPLDQPGTAPAPEPPVYEPPPRSRFVYQVLAVFLGGLGIHNFYAGRARIGLIQLLLSCTGASSIWALVEILTVRKDGSGRPMTVGGRNPKSLNKYRWLAITLGAFGIHDFYAGYSVRGFIHLALCSSLLSLVGSAVWALVEIFTVRKDSDGVAMPLGKDMVYGIVSAACALLTLILAACLELDGGGLVYWMISISSAASLLAGLAALVGGNFLMPLVSLLLLVGGGGVRYYKMTRKNRRWSEERQRIELELRELEERVRPSSR